MVCRSCWGCPWHWDGKGMRSALGLAQVVWRQACRGVCLLLICHSLQPGETSPPCIRQFLLPVAVHSSSTLLSMLLPHYCAAPKSLSPISRSLPSLPGLGAGRARRPGWTCPRPAGALLGTAWAPPVLSLRLVGGYAEKLLRRRSPSLLALGGATGCAGRARRPGGTMTAISQKERQWVLCCGERIAWLIGERTDNRFRIDETTKRVIIYKIV